MHDAVDVADDACLLRGVRASTLVWQTNKRALRHWTTGQQIARCQAPRLYTSSRRVQCGLGGVYLRLGAGCRGLGFVQPVDGARYSQAFRRRCPSWLVVEAVRYVAG